ncbi:hypothetical protein D6D17_08725 [Aureobasidium pullulans]|nr:hypothetical protein D6D17_08725 [Aureobasidium pullulans]THY02548.1 hypothetical protein D6D03_05017 [Aureobasidium pullulans]THY10004.1 hypothetical protein D6D02_06682 [Aureobasidium pullulans]
MKLYQLFLPWLVALGAVAAQLQVSKKPDASASPQQSSIGYQYSTLLTSMIRQPDLGLPNTATDTATDDQNELDAADSDSDDSDSEHAADGQADMLDADYDSDDTDSELVASASSDKGHPKKHDPDDDEDGDDKKERKEEKKEEKQERKEAKKNATRVKWYKQPNCKRPSRRSHKRMPLGECRKMHKVAAYKFKGSKKKHGKKDKDDDDDDADVEYGTNCTMKFYNDKKCQSQVFIHSGPVDTAAGCINIGRTDNDNPDGKKEKKEKKRKIWSAMLTCGDEDDDDNSSNSVGSSLSRTAAGVSKTTGLASTKAAGTKKGSKTSSGVYPTESDKNDDEDSDDEGEEPGTEVKEPITTKAGTKKSSKTTLTAEPTETHKNDDESDKEPGTEDKDSDSGWKELEPEDKKPDDDTAN